MALRSTSCLSVVVSVFASLNAAIAHAQQTVPLMRVAKSDFNPAKGVTQLNPLTPFVIIGDAVPNRQVIVTESISVQQGSRRWQVDAGIQLAERIQMNSNQRWFCEATAGGYTGRNAIGVAGRMNVCLSDTNNDGYFDILSSAGGASKLTKMYLTFRARGNFQIPYRESVTSPPVSTVKMAIRVTKSQSSANTWTAAAIWLDGPFEVPIQGIAPLSFDSKSDFPLDVTIGGAKFRIFGLTAESVNMIMLDDFSKDFHFPIVQSFLPER